MLRIAILVGSTRPGRVGEAVGKWAYGIARKSNDAEFELVDIAKFELPLLDEPVPASFGQYSHPHTRPWSAKVAVFDGYAEAQEQFVNRMLDQVIAWSGALSVLRSKQGARA
jgi:NAD(P)H-dependent FMN reductase